MLHMLAFLLTTALADTTLPPRMGGPTMLFPVPSYTVDADRLLADTRWTTGRKRQKLGRWLSLAGGVGVTVGIPVAAAGYWEGSDPALSVGVGSFFVGAGAMVVGTGVRVSGRRLMLPALVDAGYQISPNINRLSHSMMLAGVGSIAAAVVTEKDALLMLGGSALVGGIFVKGIESFRMMSVVQAYDLALAPVLRPDEKGLVLVARF